MIKSDLVEKVMEATKLKKPEATEAVVALFDGIKAALLSGNRIELRGFGVFQVKDRKRGIGRNPKTGREVEIPPGKTIRFKPGKSLRNMS
ncbi:MAG: integration host factor subunit beta [Thermoanaerobaculales bacterium]|nr:integration host factor subunit beta [Thermoanaerobaculales bacterium]